jgi:hypothetical protein
LKEKKRIKQIGQCNQKTVILMFIKIHIYTTLIELRNQPMTLLEEAMKNV